MMKFKSESKVQESSDKAADQGLQDLLKRKDLGFLQTHARNEIWESSIAWGNAKSKRHDLLMVIGMGGSSLGGQCWTQSLSQNESVLFLNNLDPITVRLAFEKASKAESPHFLVVSKSGGTLEVSCLIDLLAQWLTEHSQPISSSVSVVTELKPSALMSWAKANGVEVLAHPIDVGGRFSAFTPAGLAPAAFANLELNEIRMGQSLALENSALALDVSSFYLDSFQRGEYLSVFWMYPDRLEHFGHWLNQLWAESLPKSENRKAQAGPRVSVPLIYRGSRDQHSVLQMLMVAKDKMSVCFFKENYAAERELELTGQMGAEYVFLRGKSISSIYESQLLATQEALTEVGRTTSIFEIEKLELKTLAQLLMTFEMVIGVLGECLNINAFDQPGVELGKKITIEKLQKRTHL